METTTNVRPLHEIAQEIRKDWEKPYFGAKPYIQAMLTMDKITDAFGDDPGTGIVAYFLSNAATWRGDAAKRVKKELNTMLKKAYSKKS